MDPKLVHLPLLLDPPSSLATSSTLPRKTHHLIVEAVVCPSVAHNVPFCPHIFTYKCSAIMSHWSGSRPLASATLSDWILTRTPPKYSVVALCHGDPASLDQQDWPFHMLQQIIDGVDFGVGQLRALASLPALLHPHHQAKLSCIALDSLPNAAAHEG